MICPSGPSRKILIRPDPLRNENIAIRRNDLARVVQVRGEQINRKTGRHLRQRSVRWAQHARLDPADLVVSGLGMSATVMSRRHLAHRFILQVPVVFQQRRESSAPWLETDR